MPSRSKRPSVKGKGAEIFFGDEEATITGEELGAAQAETDASKLASMQADQDASPTSVESGPSDLDLLVFEGVLARVAEPASVTASFRFTRAELDALHDLTYRVRKRHGLRLPKQEVVRLGLAALLSEYKERGEESVLGRYIRHTKAS